MPVIAAYSVKGGVGKTSATVNLAWTAARSGLRTLVWDLDPQGAATYLFRMKARVKGGGRALIRGRRRLAEAVRPTATELLDLIPADFSYRYLDLDLGGTKRPDRRVGKLLRSVTADYDVVFLDCPPGVTLVSENIVNGADLLLVPIIPSNLSVRTLSQLLTLFESTGRRPPKVLGFFSMLDTRRKLHRELAEQLRTERPDIAANAVPMSSLVEQMGSRREPVAAFAPRSRPGLAYAGLWTEVRDCVLGRPQGEPHR